MSFGAYKLFADFAKRVSESNSPPQIHGPSWLRFGSPNSIENEVEKGSEIVFTILHHEGLP